MYICQRSDNQFSGFMDDFSVLGKKLMEKHKLGKSEMGRIMGSSRTTVYLWLSGESCPSYDQVMLLMEHLGKRVLFIDEELL